MKNLKPHSLEKFFSKKENVKVLDSQEFLDEFRKKYFQEVWIGSYNVNTNCPSMQFDTSKINPDAFGYRKNQVDTESAVRFFIEGVDEEFFGWDDDEKKKRLTNTWIYEPPISSPSDLQVLKFSNSWGYQPHYTFIEHLHTRFSSENMLINSLIITFIQDSEIEHKHRGAIKGRKFGL